MRGRPFITHRNYEREPITNGFTVCVLQHYLASDLSVKSYSMGDVRKVVPWISSAVSAIEARNGNESQLIFNYKK